MKEFYVYKIFDMNQNLLYIGKGSSNGRYTRINYYRNEYKRHSRHIDNMLKMLNGKFIVEIDKTFKKEDDAFKYEIELINNLNPRCNETDGGEGISGLIHSKSTRKRMSRAQNKITNFGIDNLKKILYENKVSDCAKIIGVSIPSLIKFKKENNISIEWKGKLENSKYNLKSAIKGNTGKRKLDKNDNIKELIDEIGITRASEKLNVSFPTLKNYCIENNIQYNKKHRYKL
jgi:hypothetical protein